MTQTVLVLGKSGRFGRNAAKAFAKSGWSVRGFDRRTDNLMIAAQGADVIVNAWNPPYPDWASQLPGLHRKVIEAAAASGSTVIVPGNVYVFGAGTPGPWSGATPHQARNPLGRIRIEMEEGYRASNVRTIILRAGDFIDTETSGNWFDRVMIKPLARGRFIYPGDPDVPHAWGYLPDLARAAVALAEMRGELPRFADVPFAGYTLTGRQIAEALSRNTGREVSVARMKWWPVQLARPFWRLAPHLIEMRYLWNTPHCLDGTFFDTLVGDFVQTDIEAALRTAIPAGMSAGKVDPDQAVAAGA
ncbi:epimerase [Ruegeria sediminis]|uniref:Epimerase n=1 Tax=Ruegeria sediminis TaxID=2583820 RepID=A0ABY2WWJ8_9RHOB|nr:NAD-dependent epimerase/dehydratase family protein [Ruegeria sediminis]TMV07135.1 epimerase [Ruegeria sediminis]